MRAGVVLAAGTVAEGKTKDMTSSESPWDWLALARRKAIPRKEPARRDFERPETAPRIPGGAQTCAVECTRGPLLVYALQPRAREKTRGRNTKGLQCAKNA